MGAMSEYFGNIARTTGSLLYGLKITFRHFIQARKSRKPIGVEDKDYFAQKDGIVTLQYPKEEFPVPDNGRYQLHNEIDDCIVCDKCAKICPVNCIDIEPVRAVEEIGKTSDGTTKRIYAAKFDIDMSKCCFCGLCTVVCPTECLTMTKDYDFSVFDLKEHTFEFSDMTALQVDERKKELEAHNAQKEKEKAAIAAKKSVTKPAIAKPAIGGLGPKVAPSVKNEEDDGQLGSKPVFKPKIKLPNNEKTDDGSSMPAPEEVKPKVQFRPKIKAAGSGKSEENSNKPVIRPKIKLAGGKKTEEDSSAQISEEAKSKAQFRPKINADEDSKTQSGSEKAKAEIEKPEVKFRPKIKPKKKD